MARRSSKRTAVLRQSTSAKDSLEEYDLGFILAVHSPVVRMLSVGSAAEHHPAQDSKFLTSDGKPLAERE